MTAVASVEVTAGPWSMLNNKPGMQHHHMPASFGDHHHPYSSQSQSPVIMERSVSPHGSEHSHYSASHYSRPPAPAGYHSPTPMQHQQPLPQMSATSMPTAAFAAFPDMGAGMPHHMQQQTTHPLPQHQPGHPQHPPQPPQPPQQSQQIQAKINPCSTCGKGFARRSDLARHERIHTGVRPHVCDHPECGKMFIQRSALTVHKRTHTGEKPHRCEICAARFSDSSSLARHRRTHWGQRPYKCPYANCQKTFTRRTTLNRHQNGHRGTIEEAAAATAAALAANKGLPGQARSEGDHLSSHGSPMTTPSPGQQRTMSMSPSVDMSMGGPRHHPADVNFLQQQNGSLPMHMRVGSPVAGGSPVSAATAAVYASGAPAAMRPTSHPTGYGPPSTLEPNLEGQQQQQQGQHQPHSAGPTSSASGSPHMSAMGWQSPTHMASPTSQSGSTHGANGAPSGSASAAAAAAAGYMYADPGDGYGSAVNAAGQMGHMFYGAAQQQAHQGQMRRGQGPEGLIHM